MQIEGKRQNNVATILFVTEFRFQVSASDEKEEADLYSRFSLLHAGSHSLISSRPDH
jgi:hypothetical protein